MVKIELVSASLNNLLVHKVLPNESFKVIVGYKFKMKHYLRWAETNIAINIRDADLHFLLCEMNVNGVECRIIQISYILFINIQRALLEAKDILSTNPKNTTRLSPYLSLLSKLTLGHRRRNSEILRRNRVLPAATNNFRFQYF